MKSLLIASCIAVFASGTLAQTPAVEDAMASLLPTPQMGWNSWNTFQTKIDEKLIKETADAMIANGMREAGYIYVNLDDGWMERQREPSGELIGDKQRFPGGMKALGDYLHERGFKFGIYNSSGSETCAHYAGTKGHEEQDMKTYASWGVDYIKMDWCGTEGMKAPETYKEIHEAIKATDRPMVLSICEWGSSKPWGWANGIGQSWRTTGDITDTYDSVERWSMGWKVILDKQVGLEKFACPGHWNDPDMLEVGKRRLTDEESRAHFSLWCMLAAPLIAGNDVRHMDGFTHKILTNKEVIALDQDPLGKQGFRVVKADEREIWIKPLKDDAFAVCLLHASRKFANKMELKWSEIPQLTGTYTVRDLWEAKNLGDTTKDWTGELQWHDVKLFKLIPNP